MTYLSDAAPVTYMGSGPAYPDETDHQAMAENAVHSLTGHMASEPAGTFSVPGQPVADAHPMAQSPEPGHGYEDEPTDASERQAQRTAQTVAQHAQTIAEATGNGLQSGFPVMDHAQVATNIRTALRGGVV